MTYFGLNEEDLCGLPPDAAEQIDPLSGGVGGGGGSFSKDVELSSELSGGSWQDTVAAPGPEATPAKQIELTGVPDRSVDLPGRKTKLSFRCNFSTPPRSPLALIPSKQE